MLDLLKRTAIVMVVLLFTQIVAFAQATPEPDYGATATAIIQQATNSAATQEAAVSSTPTRDPYLLTVTAQIQFVTQTAEVSTGNTAVPLGSESQSGDYSLTATALVLEATRAAGGVVTPDQDSSNESILSQTVLAFGALILILVILGAGAYYFTHRK